MRWFRDKVQRLAVGMVLLGSVGLMLSMLICVADVIGTNLFERPVDGTLEITESTMVLIVFGALAYTQQKGAHIRVELLHGLMGPRLRSLVDLFTHFVALVFFLLLCWHSIGELTYSWEMKEATMGTIRFPLYPARTLLTIGAALLIVQLTLDVVDDAIRTWRGEGPRHGGVAPADTAKLS